MHDHDNGGQLIKALLIVALCATTTHAANITNDVNIAGSNFESINVSVAVVSGIGFGVFSTTGTMRQCMINPPSPAATYGWEVTTDDSEAYKVMGKMGLLGKVSLFAKRILIGAHRVDFSGATPDGTYSMRCIIKK